MSDNQEHIVTEQKMPEYAVGALTTRLRRVFAASMCAFLLMLLTSAIAIGQRLAASSEHELIHRYRASMLQFDRDLYRLQRDAQRTLYISSNHALGTVLAGSESIWLDFDGLLAQQEAESYIQPPVTLEEHQLTLMTLRAGLLESLLALRAGEKDKAVLLFERGPDLHIDQLHRFVQLVLAATAEYLEEEVRQAYWTRIFLLVTYFFVIFISIILFLYTMRRAADAASSLEADLDNALGRVSRQQKLSTLGQVAGMVSHELRNPLGTIRTSVYNLGMREENKSPESRKILDRIERSVLRCDAIVASLLDYIREPKIHKESRNLLEWTRQFLSGQEFPAQISLQVPQEDVGDVSFDPELLRRACLNVLSNGCHAIEARATARGRDISGSLAISLLSREGQVGIEFRDNGMGITPENLGRVFEPLFSTKSFGIGLGMQIVQQIIKLHAGVVEIQSDVDVGTRVVLWLPASNKAGDVK